jgi:hypothetical protein
MPIVSEDAYKNTEELVREFSKPGGLGEQLQQILLKIAGERDNWVKKINYKLIMFLKVFLL